MAATIDFADNSVGVAIDIVGHLEAVGAAGTLVLDDEGDAHHIVVGRVDDDSACRQVEHRVDTFDTLGDSVVVDVVVLGALDNAGDV